MVDFLICSHHIVRACGFAFVYPRNPAFFSPGMFFTFFRACFFSLFFSSVSCRLHAAIWFLLKSHPMDRPACLAFSMSEATNPVLCGFFPSHFSFFSHFWFFFTRFLLFWFLNFFKFLKNFFKNFSPVFLPADFFYRLLLRSLDCLIVWLYSFFRLLFW